MAIHVYVLTALLWSKFYVKSKNEMIKLLITHMLHYFYAKSIKVVHIKYNLQNEEKH